MLALTTAKPPPKRWGTPLVIYGAMVCATVGAFLAVRQAGRGLTAPLTRAAEIQAGPSPGLQSDLLLRVLVALVVVVVTARVMGLVFSWLRQPAVVGEVVAGLFLGPSILGRWQPELAARLLPPSTGPHLAMFATVGVVIYMFLVGLGIDLTALRGHRRATVAISHASIGVPFVLGSTLALLLYPRLSTANVPFTSFGLFCGVAMSVTAFPVLSRILRERRIQGSSLGTVALTCAAVDDLTAWSLLALVVAVARNRWQDALVGAILLAAYLAVMAVGVRPVVARLCAAVERRGTLGSGGTALFLVAVLSSAVTTEYLGIHAAFGAFLLGAVVPAGSVAAVQLKDKLEDLVVVLFLPAFFAYTGLRTRVDLVSGLDQWLLCALIMATACAGKFGGASLAARFSGLSWRDSASLGVLMNTRGLMELIVLNIGLDLNVIPPTLFAMFVIMAVLTTLATTPLLDLIAARSARDDVARRHFSASSRAAVSTSIYPPHSGSGT
jgi:Kef-type K+ transport system membrane component KefB